MKIYQVGGVVRDQLLGLPVSDRDWVVVGSTPKEMLSLGYQPVGKSFPVFLHPETKEEYALARTEKKVSAGYHGFEFHCEPSVTLEEDLSRRDLTINAMAMDSEGHIVDPYGGQADCEKRILRHVSGAFSEDPLRVLRVARFAARFAHLGFHVSPKTAELMADVVNAGEVHTLVPERIWMELEKALQSQTPHVFLKVMRLVGALEVVLPEVNALYGVPQNPVHHPEIDTGIHTEMVLAVSAELSNSPQVRFAAMTHDLGKACTPEALWPKHTGHEEEGAKVLQALCERLRIPKTYERLGVLAARLHGIMQDVKALSPDALLDLIEKLDPFRHPSRIEDFCLACESDSRGRLGFEDVPFPQSAYLQAAVDAVLTVKAKELLAQEPKLAGSQMADTLKQHRVSALKQFMEANNGSSV